MTYEYLQAELIASGEDLLLEDYHHYKDKTDDDDDYKSPRSTRKVNLLMK